jgi:hypothetical protein
MKTITRTKCARMNSILAGLLLAFIALGFNGCADYVSAGYYVPDYRPYYVDYDYDGYPWWGPGPYYAGTIVIGDRDRHHHHDHDGRIVRNDVNVNVNRNVTNNRSIYYGGHHLAPVFRSGVASGARSTGRNRR